MDSLKEFLINYVKSKYDTSDTVIEYAKKVLEQLEKGSICLNINDKDIIEELKKSNAVGTDNAIRPLILDDGKLYVQRYYVYQKKLLEKINELAEKRKFHIITGGPGTGKTTLLKEILKDKTDKKYLMAAPTGKAALRMGNDAKTIHRLLGYRHLSVGFIHTKENPLEADIIAIDECSMVDLPMMAKLLEAVPTNCDLYLLGDKNQLASVEVGSVFADICEKFKNNDDVYTELIKNYRAENAPGITNLSRKILENAVDTFNNENVHYSEDAMLEEELPKKYSGLFKAKNHEDALQYLKTFQVLCTSKTGRSGTAYINELIKREKPKFTPVIITENNYSLNLFNGDVGVKDDKNAYFNIGEEIKSFPVLTLPAHELAFAITIHKSQGSEYESVAVVYPYKEKEAESEKIFLTKELLYTAITRAKKECFIFGSKEVLKNSCNRKIFRASGI